MEFCNLCKKNNFSLIDKYNIYNQEININYYFHINNKYYQCICYKSCSQYELYKDKQKWINYIGMLYVSNSIVTIYYNNNFYKCILVEYIPQDSYFLLNNQYNKIDKECIIITENDLLKYFRLNLQLECKLETKLEYTDNSIQCDLNKDVNQELEILKNICKENSEKINNLEDILKEIKNTSYFNEFEFDFLTV